MARWAQVTVVLADGRELTYRDVDEVDAGQDQRSGRNRGHLKIRRTGSPLLADLTAGSMLWVCVENPQP